MFLRCRSSVVRQFVSLRRCSLVYLSSVNAPSVPCCTCGTLGAFVLVVEFCEDSDDSHDDFCDGGENFGDH